MTVTRDATSLIFTPASAAEATPFLAGTGIGPFGSIWNLQEASGTYADAVGTVTLSSAFSHHATLTGWSRFFPSQSDTAGDQALNDTDTTTLVDLNTHSMTLVFYVALTGAPPVSLRSIANLGPGGSHANNWEVTLSTAHKIQITDGTNVYAATTDHGTGALPAILRYNSTAGTVDLFFGGEKIHATTFTRPAASSLGVWLGAVYSGAPQQQFGWAAALYGVNAEISDAQVAMLFTRFTTGYVASIAVTPTSPTVTAGLTQQMTAIATMGDGSTQDVTALATWSSGTPGVAIVNSSGLVTANAAGTSTITAAFGGATSSPDTVTVVPGGAHVVSIAIAPSAPNILGGATLQLATTGTYSDGSTGDITSTSTWTSNKTNVSVSSVGLVTALAPGTAMITASFTPIGWPTVIATIPVSVPAISSASYAAMLSQLFPPGKIWQFVASTLALVLEANADELGRFDARTIDLLNEDIPSTALETLPDYEIELALVVGATDTNAERQARIVARLISQQGFRPADFQASLAPLLALSPTNIVVIERTAAQAASVGDPREIYRFFIYRNPSLSGTYFLASAQALVDTIKPSHTIGTLIESIDLICDDSHSLCDRDLLGA